MNVDMVYYIVRMTPLFDGLFTITPRRLSETVEMEEQGQAQREVIILEEVRNTEEATNAEEVPRTSCVKPKKPTKRSRN